MALKNSDILVEFPGLVIIHQKIPSREVGRHTHDEHEFFMPLHGEISIENDGQITKAGLGKMLYVPPKLDHSFTSTAQGSGERVIWLIDHKLWKRHTSKNFKVTAISSNSLAKELLFYLLIHPKANGVKYFISALIETLLESLGAYHDMLSVDHMEGKVNDPRVKRSIQFMDDRLSEVSLAGVAKDSGLSLRNFNRLFLQEVGMTPKNYLIRLRMGKAKHLLKETRMTVTDIALEVGYGSLSKFIESFKKIEGRLPSDYRAN